jgi:hypothetical protein
MHFTPMFACGHMDFPGWFIALAGLFLAAWLATFIFALINPWLISSTEIESDRRRLHYIFYLFYLGWGIAQCVARNAELSWVGAFGIPICAIAHFVKLVAIQRRIKKEELVVQAEQSHPSQRSDYHLPFGGNQHDR